MNKSFIAALAIVVVVATASVYFTTTYTASIPRSTFAITASSSTSFAYQTTYCCPATSQTSLNKTTSFHPDSYFWSMPMMSGVVNRTWMTYPTRSVGISEAVLLMKNPPSYVTAILANDTVQFHSQNITILAFGMMPDDAANLTGMKTPSYSTDDVFVIYGLINPTLEIPSGAQVHLIFVNLDDDMQHNFVLTMISPPYAYMPMQGMMGGWNTRGSFLYMMPVIAQANYDLGTAYSYSYDITLGSQAALWYTCTYPGHAQSGMYGEVIITG